MHDKFSTLIECTKENLIHVDKEVSDTESIYSIMSYEEIDSDIEQYSDDESYEFSNNMIENSKKYLGQMDQLDDIEEMLGTFDNE